MASGSRRPGLRHLGAGLVCLAVLAGACSDDDAAPPATETTVGDPSGRLQVQLVDAPTESQPVGPPAASPLALVRRDCGSSEPLPAGGAIWLYCDTTLFEPGGRLRWFVNTSAAVATDGEPLGMRERPAGDGLV